MPDHRLDELKECELCDSGEYSVQTAPQPSACSCEMPAANAEVDEALVQKITDMIMEKLSWRSFRFSVIRSQLIMASIERFEDIQAWQKARELPSAVYKLCNKAGLSSTR